jgi:PAS domain S-box-containing protein
LRASEATARSLFENASQGILTADESGMIADANAMAERLFGYSRDELIGTFFETLLPESLRSQHLSHRATHARQSSARPLGQGMDLVARRKDGSEFPVEISLSYVTEHQSGLAMAFISDITARKQANEEREGLIGKLEAALSEKTVLLKEVHHRVKNNLAVIAGLLGMQAGTLADERAKLALGESQQRVLSMALIHEYLYASDNLDRVNFGKYVEQLANELCVSYAIESNLVSVIVEAEEIELPVHRAIPCGLILNELLSNTMKYGFPNGRSGRIRVCFARLESGGLSLSCQDDGVGIPESFDWKNPRSLGLRIVRILTKQIDGDLTLDRSGGGTRFELRFPAHGASFELKNDVTRSLPDGHDGMRPTDAFAHA